MKTIKVFSILLIAICCRTITAHAHYAEKIKTYTQSYPLQSNQVIKISNKFGKVVVNSWNRNEVKVEATIITSAKDERMAQQLLDHINIESRAGTSITFTTRFSGSTARGKSSQSKMEVNYVIYMPSSNPLEIKNEFGNTFLPDWKGVIDIDQAFGELSVGSIANVKSIRVKFGGLNATAIHGGDIKISYSKLHIDKLTGTVSGKIDFCSGVHLGLHNALEKLDLKTSYSDIVCKIAPALDATFQISTSYGDLKNLSGTEIVNQTREKRYGPTFDKSYKGVKGSGKVPVNISASFGNITLK
ncbi:hypothetical protein [Niabella digestorum]|uniref:Adhesin domain-containing protein n=1 Tax=Niabella digestorum TaxID=3117701 RepID=A0ABU7RF08_9BACT